MPGKTSKKERVIGAAKKRRIERQEERNLAAAERRIEGIPSRWEAAKAARKRQREVAGGEMQPRSRLGFIIKRVNGHETLVFDTERAYKEHLVASSIQTQVDDEKVVRRHNKKASRKKTAAKKKGSGK